METTKEKTPCEAKKNRIDITTYVPCLYEWFSFTSKKHNRKGNGISKWKTRVIWALVLYVLLVSVYHLMVYAFKDYLNNTEPYKYAIYILASIIIWPFIIVYDSELYYQVYQKLLCLFKTNNENLKWYRNTAQKCFTFQREEDSKGFWGTIVSISCSIIILGVYILKNYGPNKLPQVIESPLMIVLCIFVCFCCIILAEKNRNLNITLFVVCCGLAYYVYLIEYSDTPIPTLFLEGFVFGDIIICFLLVCVFFVAGTTIYPMLGVFKVFFLSDFEKRISYPVNEIACSLDTIQEIKKYFLHLTGVNLLAYFQLLGSVYLLGILDRDSILTTLLFILGSFFPVIMYLAASVFFKKLCHKIYTLQVKDIDNDIHQQIVSKNVDTEHLQALVSVKEMYANEFEIHAAMSKEILAAMLSPIATAILAVVFPVSNVIGG